MVYKKIDKNDIEIKDDINPIKNKEGLTMNLPKVIRIGSADYEVSMNKRLSSRDGVWGLVDYGSSTIEIEDGISLSKIRETLAHEMLHAIIHEAGIRGLEEEEEYVTAIGPVLAMVLRDNDFTFMRDERPVQHKELKVEVAIENANIKTEAPIEDIAKELQKLNQRRPVPKI